MSTKFRIIKNWCQLKPGLSHQGVNLFQDESFKGIYAHSEVKPYKDTMLKTLQFTVEKSQYNILGYTRDTWILRFDNIQVEQVLDSQEALIKGTN